jgi:acyl-CoA synthetase (AMP-forming)/AMP-acid ligase II/NAD(P)-dependent dehydrogenase (short-subunit alcohol dehydrogenase family)/acyl carrier protein
MSHSSTQPASNLAQPSPELSPAAQAEAALLALPGVEAGRVLARNTDRGDQELVAYVVLSGPGTPNQAAARLQAELPTYLLPRSFVPLPNLPLTKTGAVDDAVLVALPVIDDDLVRRWEAKLKEALPDIEQVAVVTQERVGALPALHLSDLIPDWQATAEERPESLPAAEANRETGRSAVPESAQPALSHGDPLSLPADAPVILADVLERAARQEPVRDIIYLHPDGTESRQSYAELLVEAQRILAGLRRLGLKPQDRVIFQFERMPDFIAAFWGCALGGFTPAPIAVAPTYDHDNSAVNKLRNAWQLLERPLVLTSARLAPAIVAWAEQSALAEFRIGAIEDLRRAAPDQNRYAAQEDEVALLLLTSGSTGMPKAVQQSHHALLSRSAATAQMNHFTGEDVSLNWFPLDHVGGLVMFHLHDVYLTCRQIQAPIDMVLQAPLRWLDWIERYQATITWAPNFAFGLINAQAEALEQRRWDLSSMRFILNGGEAIVAAVARRFLALLEPHGLPATAMHPAWGMSETCSGVTFNRRFTRQTTSDKDTFVEVGRPIPGFSMRIVDGQNQVLSEGREGRLQVKGLSVTSGYYQNPDLNREVFTADGWFNTGDLGVIRDGALTITGREKDVIIINGVNYYSHEIEKVVETVSGVAVSYTAAVAVRNAAGDTDKLAIIFNPISDTDADLVDLLQRIRAAVVQDIGVNPTYLVPVEKEAIPKTEIGKIQRPRLAKAFMAGAFDDIVKRVDILTANQHTLPDWFYRREWQAKRLAPRAVAPNAGRTLLFLDNLGLGLTLSQRLEDSIMVEAGPTFAQLGPNRYQLDPGQPEHYERLFQSLAAEDIQVGQILHLWNYQPYNGEAASLQALEQAQMRGLYSLLFLAQALLRAQGDAHPVRLLVIASHSQLTAPTDKLTYETSSLPGLLKTIPLELPWLHCRHLDLEVGAADNSNTVLAELAQPGGDPEVAYRKGQRLTPALLKVAMSDQAMQEMPLKAGGIYLLTGGLGGIGVHLAHLLLEKYGARLLIVGRTSLPDRSEWSRHLEQETPVAARLKRYQLLEATGGEVIYRAVDVCDLPGLQAAVAEAEATWAGQLAGVIHLAEAGNLARHWQEVDQHQVSAETVQTFETLFRPKVYGTWTLTQLIKQHPQALFIAFSSVTGIFGAATLGAFSAASSFLDGFCLHRRRHAHPQTYCFSWSIWDDLGLSEGNPAYARDAAQGLGYYVISKTQGLQALLAGLHRPPASLIVGLDGCNPNMQRVIQGASANPRQLTAYLTSRDNGFAPSQLATLTVPDRFGTPSQCQGIWLAEMPLAENGEIDRAQLLALNRQGPKSKARVAPRNEVERQLADIWQELLAAAQIGIYDNFFELGGHSLAAMQLISRIRGAFQVELPLRNLFEEPTVAYLADNIRALKLVQELQATPVMADEEREIGRL